MLHVVAHNIWKHLEYACHLKICIDRDILNVEPTGFLETVHFEIQDWFMEKIKHEVLNVSKSVAWYKKYVHIKACLKSGYIPKSPEAGQDVFYTYTWEDQLY
jgi:hypothetical protein